MRRLAWTLWWAGAAFAVLVVCGAGLAASAAWGFPRKPWSGNLRRPDNNNSSAKIAVFGDTQKGLAGFAALAELAKKESVDLAIHTGDLVSHADVGHYDLAATWVIRAFGFGGVPFVVVPGNHDIKGGEGLFEERIGPRQFSFPWGPVDIVVIDNSTGPPDEAAAEKLLHQADGPILLFMHVPPIEAPTTNYVPKPAYQKFLQMIRKYSVTHVFSGHAHGYSKTQQGSITFISNGVGGDSDSWQFDQKACMTIVEASEKGIDTREVSIDPVFSLWANVEHLAIGHVGEIVFRRIWGIPALLVLILALFWSYRRLRKKRQKGAEREELKLRFTPAKASDPPDIVV